MEYYAAIEMNDTAFCVLIWNGPWDVILKKQGHNIMYSMTLCVFMYVHMCFQGVMWKFLYTHNNLGNTRRWGIEWRREILVFTL